MKEERQDHNSKLTSLRFSHFRSNSCSLNFNAARHSTAPTPQATIHPNTTTSTLMGPYRKHAEELRCKDLSLFPGLFHRNASGSDWPASMPPEQFSDIQSHPPESPILPTSLAARAQYPASSHNPPPLPFPSPTPTSTRRRTPITPPLPPLPLPFPSPLLALNELPLPSAPLLLRGWGDVSVSRGLDPVHIPTFGMWVPIQVGLICQK